MPKARVEREQFALNQDQWETVYYQPIWSKDAGAPSVQRFPVPGGWLYLVASATAEQTVHNVAFVPKPE